MNSTTLLAMFLALITLATIAVMLSQHAQTASVIQAIGSATGSAIGAAVAPVTQSNTSS